MFSDDFCIFLGQEMVKGRQRAYCFVWLLFTTGTDVLFLATSCLLYTDTVPLILPMLSQHNDIKNIYIYIFQVQHIIAKLGTKAVFRRSRVYYILFPP